MQIPRNDPKVSQSSMLETISHFWVAQSAELRSALFVVPHFSLAAQTNAESNVPTRLELFDADGASASMLEVQFPLSEVAVVELEPLLSGVKLESGMQHGHLLVKSPGEYKHQCRIQGKNGAALHSGLVTIKSRENSFFPIFFQRGSQNMLAVVNYGVDPANLVVRLFVGNRAPEINLSIPPHGSRIFILEEEFFGGADPFGGREQSGAQGYIRISTRHQGAIGVQLMQPYLENSGSEDGFKVLAN